MRPLKLIVTTLALLSLAAPALAAERWLAVGYGGRRMVSSDGMQWEITGEWAQPGADDSNNLMSAVFAQGKFVVVGGGGGGKTAAGHILTSYDGREWVEVYTSKSRINPVVYGNGRFVAGVSSFPSGKLLWSDDGSKWNDGASIAKKRLTHFRHGAFGNDRFVLVGNGGEGGKMSWAITSQDGTTIATERDDLPGHGVVVFGAGRFLMLAGHNKAQLLSSEDGDRWEAVAIEGAPKFNWLVWTGSEFVAGDGKTAYRSTDGQRWNSETLTARGNVKWSDGQRFITSSWPGKMAYSKDGRSWQESPPMPANGINVVVLGQVE
jgi:hypothetical protein